jgi:hypothetical protein
MDGRQELLSALNLIDEQVFTREELDRVIDAILEDVQCAARMMSGSQATCGGLAMYINMKYKNRK